MICTCVGYRNNMEAEWRIFIVQSSFLENMWKFHDDFMKFHDLKITERGGFYDTCH